MQKFRIISMLHQDLHPKWNKHLQEWEKYFEFSHSFLTVQEFGKILDQNVHVLFLDARDCHLFKGEYYKIFKDRDKNFTYILVKNAPEDSDYLLFKNWGDNVVYLDRDRKSVWQTIAILRRYWSTYSKPSTVIYKGLVVDFIEKKVLLNGAEVYLTSKEFFLLKFLLENKRKHVTKQEMFKKVWNIQDEDFTRVVDQILFKLKKKIGSDFFSFSYKKGVLFE